MDDFAYRLIARAPILLVAVAVAFFIGGVLNGLNNYMTLNVNADYSPGFLTFLWGMLYGALYQPSILLGWAAAIHYLSVIAGRRT